MKNRVMEIWREKHKTFAQTFDNDTILQAIQCYAEDLLFFETGLEVE